ncbi:hypothetical protein FRB93_010383 [Tulasnella sp. JGI-2019a]|nr:hypothetical protein FRB93_010383 [Tulasnella sp. JGI-2019a]
MNLPLSASSKAVQHRAMAVSAHPSPSLTYSMFPPLSVHHPLSWLQLHGVVLHSQSHENTGHGNFTESVTIPTTGTYTLSIVVTSIFGINNGATLNPFTTNIKAT